MKTAATYLVAFAVTLLLAAGIVRSDDMTGPDRHDHQPAYRIIELASLGGTSSRGNAINDRGWVAGYSHFPGDQTRRAVLWRDGEIINLGSLGGDMANSNVPWPGINNRGMVVGISQTDEDDPNNEEWSCRAFFPLGSNTGPVCAGFAWEAGEMIRLPTLAPDGTHGFATGVNNRGQIVGWAETGVVDETCVAPQQQQFIATRWELRNGTITTSELPPLPGTGDTSTAATAINERGQAVGISGTCDQAVGRFTARHAVYWDSKDNPFEIDNLGGKAWHTPMDINESGHIVGFSNISGGADDGAFNAHAFLWTEPGKIKDLGTLGDDAFSQAFGINDRGQVVGVSFGGSAGHNRAFLWRNGKLLNLNDLAHGYTGILLNATHINDRGEITGAALSETGETVAYIAKPVRKR